jgi:hypothetical protein
MRSLSEMARKWLGRKANGVTTRDFHRNLQLSAATPDVRGRRNFATSTLVEEFVAKRALSRRYQ